jgi:hypothetical protein
LTGSGAHRINAFAALSLPAGQRRGSGKSRLTARLRQDYIRDHAFIGGIRPG